MILLSLALMLAGALVGLVYLAIEHMPPDMLHEVISPRELVNLQLQSESIAQAAMTLFGFGAITWWLA